MQGQQQDVINVAKIDTGVYLMDSSQIRPNIKPVSLHRQPGKKILHLLLENVNSGEFLLFSGTSGNMRKKEVFISGSESDQKSGVSPHIITSKGVTNLETLELVFS